MESAALSLVGNVGQLVGSEYRQLRGVGGQVAELRDELATMNALLRMQSEADEGAVDHFVREWMKQVRELAYDAEDCVHLYIFRVRCLPKDRFLVWSRRLLSTFFPRRRLAREIDALRARAVAISERHARYGVNREALRRSPFLGPPAAVSSARALHHHHAGNDPDQFVGIRDQANALAEMVKAAVSNDERDMKLKVFSIVGFGGLGKTTLAMEVCRQLEPDFQRQAQVSVSQAFDGRKDLAGLLKRVLRQIVKPKAGSKKGIKVEDPLGDIDKMDVDELARKLKELLQDMRYLIVVDDIWTIAAWDAIQSRLPENNCGSRIIVTTRIETVARACSHASVYGNYIYQIKPLGLEDSKKLFLSRAFGSMNASYPKDLEQAMDKILKKCGGLPLAIVSIASLLASYNSSGGLEIWMLVCNSIGSQMESNPTLEGMRQIVTLSYNHLPHYLKDCIMYLAIFPEDYVISKNRLLQRWIAEGLVVEKRGLTMMEVAEAYFDELVSRSMIDRATSIISFYDRVETCRVHDMMLEVMVSKSLEANFISLVGGQYEGISYDRIRRLSIHGGEEGATKADVFPSKKKAVGNGRRNGVIDWLNVQHIRSLSMFDPEGHKLLDRMAEFTLLRVLDMEDCKGLTNTHMKDICRMYLLSFLSLKGTDISVMPPEVGDLEHLQTLDLEETSLDSLPETVTKLEKLERLKFYKKGQEWWIMWKPPSGLSNMKALREVGRILLGDVGVAQEIGDLVHLQRIFVYVDDNSQQKEVRRELAISLGKLYSLRWLDVGDMNEGGNTLDYLIDLPSPPQLLRYLRFAGGFAKLPEWVGSLTYLVDLTLSWTQLVGDQLFDVLCKLPNLKSILFQHLFYSGDELVVSSAHNFPVLKDMTVTSPREFPRVFRFEEGSMTKLETLSVNFDKWGEKRIVGVEHLRNLKEVQLTGNRGNPALDRTLKQLRDESDSRSKPNQFKIRVKYD